MFSVAGLPSGPTNQLQMEVVNVGNIILQWWWRREATIKSETAGQPCHHPNNNNNKKLQMTTSYLSPTHSQTGHTHTHSQTGHTHTHTHTNKHPKCLAFHLKDTQNKNRPHIIIQTAIKQAHEKVQKHLHTQHPKCTTSKTERPHLQTPIKTNTWNVQTERDHTYKHLLKQIHEMYKQKETTPTNTH